MSEDAIFDFRDLDALGFSLLQEINQRYLNKLYAVNASADVECVIEIDNLSIHSIGDCELIIKNVCVSNSKTGIYLLVDSLREVILMLDKKKQDKILESLDITIDDLNKPEDNAGFIGDCVAYAETAETINIGTFKIGKCYSTDLINPTKILFVNSGSASANCALSKISKGFTFLNDNATKKDQYIDSILGFSFNSIIWYLFIICVVLLLLCIITNIMYNQFNVSTIFVSRNDLDGFTKSFYLRPPVIAYVDGL